MKQTFVGQVHWWTPRALLFQDHFWHRPEWYPLSQVEIVNIDMDHLEFTITASKWITSQKEIYEGMELMPLEEEDDGDS